MHNINVFLCVCRNGSVCKSVLITHVCMAHCTSSSSSTALRTKLHICVPTYTHTCNMYIIYLYINDRMNAGNFSHFNCERKQSYIIYGHIIIRKWVENWTDFDHKRPQMYIHIRIRIHSYVYKWRNMCSNCSHTVHKCTIDIWSTSAKRPFRPAAAESFQMSSMCLSRSWVSILFRSLVQFAIHTALRPIDDDGAKNLLISKIKIICNHIKCECKNERRAAYKWIKWRNQ